MISWTPGCQRASSPPAYQPLEGVKRFGGAGAQVNRLLAHTEPLVLRGSQSILLRMEVHSAPFKACIRGNEWTCETATTDG